MPTLRQLEPSISLLCRSGSKEAKNISVFPKTGTKDAVGTCPVCDLRAVGMPREPLCGVGQEGAGSREMGLGLAESPSG